MIGLRRREARHSERGAAALEFALIAPILIFLLFGIIGYGYMLNFRQSLSQAGAEGARAAGVAVSGIADTGTGDTKQTRAREAVNSALGGYGVTCTSGGKLQRNGADAGTCTISVPVTCTGATSGSKCAKIELEYLYKANPLLPSPGLGPVLPTSLKYTTEVEVNQ